MTTPDFQTQLRLQLREAARREERRSALAPPTGWWRAGSPVLAAAAVALLALALVVAGLALRGPNPDRTAEPKAVERLPVAGSLGPVMSAFGSVWAVDTTGRLIRIDPVSRDVISSLDVPARTGLAAGAGAMWVGDDQAIQRVDARTGRVRRPHPAAHAERRRRSSSSSSYSPAATPGASATRACCGSTRRATGPTGSCPWTARG